MNKCKIQVSLSKGDSTKLTVLNSLQQGGGNTQSTESRGERALLLTGAVLVLNPSGCYTEPHSQVVGASSGQLREPHQATCMSYPW